MGLDMYLHRRKKGDEEGDSFEQLMYWRKANHIHAWFDRNITEDGIEDCECYVVSKSDLEELRDTCATVLGDIYKAKEVLPTQDGFFFGPTDYTWYYMQDVYDTCENLVKIIEDYDELVDDEHEIVYHAWW